MTTVFVIAAAVEVAAGLALLLRLARGPSVPDRIVALNALSTQCALAVVLFAAFADRTIYLDLALWLASFSYLMAILFARYLDRGFL